jgi:RNA polymerase sigma-70 factor (ECF subfamily)
LRDSAAAEDAVQDTLLAALAGEANFAGRSNLRTWLTGILKHKIVDTIRRQSRERPASELEPDGDARDFDGLFDRRGHWEESPHAWQQPEGSLQQKQFFAALEACLRALPERTARVFMMREHLGLETSEICKELGVTPTHCWVMLHRARMALRLCSENDAAVLQGNDPPAFARRRPQARVRRASCVARAPGDLQRLPQCECAVQISAFGGEDP